MIEQIRIKGPASFKDVDETLSDLSQFNYIYGSNGSGKTTISRLIANVASYPDCQITWKGGTLMEPLVYNRDFVERNFSQSAEVKGIFTLGEKDQSILDKIAEAKAALDKINNAITALNVTLGGEDGTGGELGKLTAENADFEERCWRIKGKYDDKFQGAFSGVRGTKRAFKDRVLSEASSNTASLKDLADLEQRASTVFGQSSQEEIVITSPDWQSLTDAETHAILAKKIIGKGDVDIAALIEKLENSDWVKEGRSYLTLSDEQCPFCQQTFPAGLEESLNAYFDESFERDMAEARQLRDDYATTTIDILTELSALLDEPSRFLDGTGLKVQADLLRGIVTSNELLLDKKLKEGSMVVQLQTHAPIVKSIKDLLGNANAAIVKHNTMVANLPRERRSLTSDVWRYLLDIELKADLANHITNRTGLEKGIANLRSRLEDGAKAKRDKKEELQALEKQTTSIEPTVTAINALLASFGFESFKLAKAEAALHYRLIRSDYSDAKDTLSEGERTFVTFLYFYHLLKGSLLESGITTDRVVVFDDPVSSLDSDVLFIVSNLIKGLFDEVRAGRGRLKQLFILTHNVYFHKEVTYNPNRKDVAMTEETFWIIRKVNGTSMIEKYPSNPIKTSYELLWAEVRKPSGSNLYIQNTLRRIIENYFKILGSIDPDKICNMFTGPEKLICRSLFSWVNDGSHYAHDDLYVSIDDSGVARYMEVFRRVFVESGNEAHYNMMMGLNTPSATSDHA
jgi:wobble nucleotide-excising tRNase